MSCPEALMTQPKVAGPLSSYTIAAGRHPEGLTEALTKAVILNGKAFARRSAIGERRLENAGARVPQLSLRPYGGRV
jgi:hypothetical protein